MHQPIKIILLSGLAFMLLACERVSNEPVKAVQVVDDSGETVSLEKPAVRIIALAPHLVENVYSAGAGDLLVARVDYSDYPEQAKRLPKVGGYKTLNLEAIAELQPDIIFAWQSGISADLVSKLKQLGFPVYLDEPNKIEDVAKAIRHIGELTGRQAEADLSAQQHLTELEQLKTKQKNKSSLNVFYQVWQDPLHTINGEQIISDVVSLCGGVNIFASETIKAPIVSVEAIVENNPQVIMTGGEPDSITTAMKRWYQWPEMAAVKHNNLFVVNSDIVSRHTRRIVKGAEMVCEKLDQARTNLSIN